MRAALLTVFAALVTALLACAEPFAEARPIAVLIEYSPWFTKLDSYAPSVALYENGEMIFARMAQYRLTYYHTTLDARALDAVRKRLQPILAIPDLKRRYQAAVGVHDLPSASLYVGDGEREVATHVYGLVAPELLSLLRQRAQAATVPMELRELHEWLSRLDYPDSKLWLPPSIEVTFREYSQAPGESIHWPREWPGLDSAVTCGYWHCMVLDGKLLPELEAFLATQKGNGAVEVSGKKMLVSYRLDFPGGTDLAPGLRTEPLIAPRAALAQSRSRGPGRTP